MITKRKTKKRSYKQSVLLSLGQLESANCSLIAELEALGFYDERLSKTEVYLVWTSQAYGYQYYGGDGSICIPRISLSVLLDRYHGVVTSLKDVLRHEYGHAVADTHRGLMRSRKFSDAFGAPHDPYGNALPYDADAHVTEYAASKTGEDFAEVFYLFIKHKGVLPSKYQKPAIRRKWRFLEELRRAIIKGKRRW